MDAKTRDAVIEKVSRGEIARRLNINVSAVSRWFSRGKIPAERVLAVEEISGVSRSRLRPDIYPPRNRSQSA
jgi:DNA-binding transcriptional regulator YdaS (Cro superfamily)